MSTISSSSGVYQVNNQVPYYPPGGLQGITDETAPPDEVFPDIWSAEHIEYVDESAADEIASQPVIGFSDMLAEAIREEVARSTAAAGATAGADMSDIAAGLTDIRSQGIEQMVLASASAGESSNSQMALLMLMMIMQMGDSGNSSMLMQVMGALLSQIENESQSRLDSPFLGDAPGATNMSNREVFQVWLPGQEGTGRAGLGLVKLPLAVWTAATPAVTSTQEDRSPERYRAVLDQFRVQTAPRYRPGRDGFTYCNIYVLDATRAMGVHIPQMGAIAMCNWLGTTGAEYGWREVDAETAQRYANEGKPAVTSAGSIGHVQMVSPSRDGDFDPVRGVAIAQAGSIVTNYMHITGIYGSGGMRQVRYFVND